MGTLLCRARQRGGRCRVWRSPRDGGVPRRAGRSGETAGFV